ncbi:hypothetical protein [uncultured Roseivirga sp.]|uniref:hypothetical protein n=1 Tax=uncultured Roseivirga sp. TaxID=543088 RepID=UPI0030DC9654|tara:strand:- start:83051 stop:84505 length:1455 start_codon:yes stop_codon:yes gene_type:complete
MELNSLTSGYYDIASIFLDPKNKRHNVVSGELLAIREMLHPKHEVFDLAKDIVNLGNRLDPSSKLIIYKDNRQGNRYIVFEGNRRITALKTLMNPQLAEGLPEANGFKKLSEKFLQNPLKQVECVELTPEDAQIWIKRKHYRGMGGAGTKEWDPIARSRSDAEEGIYDRWYAAVSFLSNHGYDCGYILSGLEDKSSVAERVFGSKYIKELLGVNINRDGSVNFENDDLEVGATLLVAIFEAIIDSQFNTTTVELDSDRKAFLESFLDLGAKAETQKDEQQNSSSGTNESGETSNSSNNDQTNNSSQGNNGGNSTSTQPTAPRKRQRKKLADKGLKIAHNQMHNFYVELAKLPVETYKHCSSVMIRVFLEKLTMIFLEEMSIPCPSPNPSRSRDWKDFDVKLQEKVKTAVNYIDPNNRISGLKYARELGNGVKDRIHTTDALHSYIHEANELPSSSEVITTWDRLHPFFKAMCDRLSSPNRGVNG